MENIIQEIREERARQEEKFPESEIEVSNRARGHNEAIERCLELIEEILP